jgi:DNA-binding transcriptional MerR regulator
VRLRLIDRLLRRGYTIAVIRDLLDAWAGGRDLHHVLGLEAAVSESWSTENPSTATVLELRRMFGRQLTPAVIRRAIRLEILIPAGLRAFHVPSPGLLEAGRDLVAAGIPLRTVLDVIEHVADELDRPAERLIRMVFEQTFPADAPGGIPEGRQVQELTATVEKLRPHALKAIDALAARSLARAVDHSFDDLAGRVSTAAPTGEADRRDA